MAWGAVTGAVIGGMLSSGASRDAADAQVGAANAASASNERIFDRQVKLQEPFRNSGLAANNKLMYFLGLNPSDYGGPGASEYGMTYETLRQKLLPQYSKENIQQITLNNPNYDNDDPFSSKTMQVDIPSAATIDERSLDSEIYRRLEEQRVAEASAAQNPEYGSLLRDFSISDFEADPGYAFRQTEGMKGIENSAASRGSLLSGSALKAIQKYSQDLASQEYGNAYSRFNANQTNKYNKLAGLVNTGQGATNQLTNAAGQLGQSNAQNIIGAGNAQAAGSIGQANAWNQAIGQGYNMYQQNQLMDLIRKPGGSTAYGSSFTPSYGYWSGGNYQVD